MYVRAVAFQSIFGQALGDDLGPVPEGELVGVGAEQGTAVETAEVRTPVAALFYRNHQFRYGYQATAAGSNIRMGCNQ